MVLEDWVLLKAKSLQFMVGCLTHVSKCIGPFKIEKPIEKVACKLHIPGKWRLHDVFQVSLLAKYKRDVLCNYLSLSSSMENWSMRLQQ